MVRSSTRAPPTVVPEAQPRPEESTAVLNDLNSLRQETFAEPLAQLTTLLSQSRRAFLIGAGCSKCAGLPLMDELTSAVLRILPETGKARAVLTGVQSHFSGAKGCTIEDYMSELVDFLAVADRRSFRSATNAMVPIGTHQYATSELTDSLTEIKNAIAHVIKERAKEVSVHRDFVRTVHRVLQSGKAGPSFPTEYFVLNYDTLVEDSLSLERIPLADGMNGGATGWWDAGAYDDGAAQARVFKVHGSIDWCLWGNDVLPRRVRHGLNAEAPGEPVLIWPASTKYRETQRDPFAQIIEMMRRALRPPSESQVVLAVCGYSFGDAHINIELDRALHESRGRLTMLAFTSDDAPSGQLQRWRANAEVCDQVRIHANKGFYHGKAAQVSDAALPWWRFEVLTRLLGGER